MPSLRSLLQAIVGSPRRPPAEQERLDRAVAAVDRELAANLELTSMFAQTHQAFVFENGEYARHRAVLEAELPAEALRAADLYRRIPETESAMERRGPANSLKDEDRRLVEGWEGDARALQISLRAGARAPLPSRWSRLGGRLRGS